MIGTDLVKLCAMALICTVVAVVLRQIRGELSFAVGVAGGIMIFGILVLKLRPVADELFGYITRADGSEYFEVMLKAIGIAFLAHITASVCRGGGESGLASAVETAGKLEIVMLCLPMVSEILGYAVMLLE